MFQLSFSSRLSGFPRALRISFFSLLAAVGIASAYAQRQTLPNAVRPDVLNHKAALVNVAPADQVLHFSIVLPLRNQSALTSLLADLYNPASAQYRHFLSVEQFTAQFGPTADDFAAVVAYARSNGLTVSETPQNRLIVPVSGSVADINAAFHVQMNVYQHPTEARTFLSPDRAPSVDLAVPLQGISGLDTYSLPQPMLRKGTDHANGVHAMAVLGSGPGGSYLGSDMRAAYYGGTALTGLGQTVGLVEYGGYAQSDVDLTFSNAGQTYSVPITNVLLDGVTTGSSVNDGEQVLDIVQAIGMAPGLSGVRVYIGAGSDDAHVLNSIATENIAKQIGCSWSWRPADPAADEPFFQEMAAQGQSFLTASGDSGAYDAAINPFFYPQEDPYVTSVGGTHLTTSGAAGTWVSETVWNSGGDGSGGGISPDNLPIPSYQAGLANSANGGSTTLRNVPDVSMEGDFDNYSCENGTCSGTWAGTSFAAPRWAGFMALVNQQANEAGNAPTGGLGFLNPTIYQLAQGSTTSGDFHDITSGTNHTSNQPVWFSATTGYDLTTGWGSANGQKLIDDLAGPQLPGFWLTNSLANVGLSPGETTTSTLTVTPAGGFTGNVTLAVSGLPTGVTASFSPNPTTGSTTITFTASTSAQQSSQTVTVTGSSGTLSASTKFTLVIHTPTFGLAATPSTLPVNVGSSATSTVTVVPLYGFTGAVNLSVSGLPAGVSAQFAPASTTGSSTLTITASSAANPATSTLLLTGTSGTITVSTNLVIRVSGPTFQLSVPSPINMGQGSSTSASLYISDLYGFTGNVNLAVTGLPSGVTATVNPNPATTSATILFTATPSAAIGTSTVTITGTSGTINSSASLTLGIFAPTFTIGSGSSLSIGQGSSANTYVYITDEYGFNGAVNLSVSGMPAGMTAIWSGNPTTSSTTLTLAATSTTKTGTYPLTISGASGSQTATAALTATVNAPSFTLNNYGAVTVGQGKTTTTTIYVNAQYGFTGSVALAASSLPSGVTATFSPNPTTGYATMTLTATSAAATGQYNVVITGTSGTLSATTTLPVTVATPTFTLTNYGGINVGQGSTQSGYVYVNGQNGFTGNVTLSVSGLPSGVTGTFSTNPTTYSSQLQLSASSTALVGQYTITITGTSGSQSATTTMTVGVYKPTFTLSASGLTLGQGATATSYAYVSQMYGFTGAVTLSMTGLPSGVTVAYSPNPTTYSSLLTFTASAAVPTGTYTVTLNGTSGSTTASTTFQIVVATPGFTLSSSSATVGQGGTGYGYVYVYGQNGFTGSVQLSVTGLPSGVTAAISPNPISSNYGSGNITFTVPSTTPTGSYTLTITGTSGSLTQTTTMGLTIAAPSFTIYGSGSPTLNPGGTTTDYLYIQSSNFSGSVTFSASGLPAGLTASFSPATSTYSTTMTLAATTAIVPGTYSIAVTGTSGSLTSTVTVPVVVNAPGFTLAASPGSQLLNPGGSGKSIITFTPVNGFTGSVAYTITGLPAGVTAAISPNPASAAATIAFTVAANATPAASVATVTGTSGSATASIPIPVNISAPALVSTTTLALSSQGTAVTAVAQNSPVTLTATVLSGATPVANGLVAFCDAASKVCDPVHTIGTASIVSGGQAFYTFVPGLGAHNYSAVFAGTTTYLTSTSTALPLTVTGVQNTTTNLTSSGSAGNYTLTASVSAQGDVAPTGNVSFLDTTNGNYTLGSAKLGVGTATVAATTSSITIPFTATMTLVGDFNGDGVADVLLFSGNSANAVVMLGNGDGTFRTGTTFALGSSPSGVVVGDFNHDGKLDFVMTRSSGNVGIFVGNGDGTFTPASGAPGAGANPSMVVAADFNNDGVLDLAVVNSYSATLTLLLGNGDGTFNTVAATPSIGSYATSLVVGDFNRDGRMDIAVANGSVINILLGNGDGTFSAGTSITSSATLMSLADLNSDGKLDLVLTSTYGGINVFLGNGDGTFATPTSYTTSYYPGTPALVDVDGDGVTDILLGGSTYGSAVTLLSGHGDGTFGAATTLATVTSANGLWVADLNGDGTPDFLVANTSTPNLTVGTLQRTWKATASSSGISPLGTGQHAVDAKYAGDGSFAASVSSTVQLTAQQGAPTVTVTPPAGSLTFTQTVPVNVTVSGGSGNPVPSGSVTLASGFYTSPATALINGSATITIPAQTLPPAMNLLTVRYTPDAASSSTYMSASGSGSVTIAKATPTITWTAPAAIPYGTALSATQLNATSSVPGSFTYTPAAGVVLSAGQQTLNVLFTPTDGVNYTTATASVSLTISGSTPAITWATPSAITYGTALSATQLNATASVPGTFIYTPAAGAVLSAGQQTLSVVFTPTDKTNYTTANASVSIQVNAATPVITWAAPAAITYGTALSATQLNATASVPGTFIYTPAAGAVLPAGQQALSVVFTPTDKTNYTTANASVSIQVNAATPVITWATPAAITYGTALSAAQLNATTSVPGTFAYSVASGTVLPAGSQTITATFTPTDTTSYKTATSTVQLMVNKAALTVSAANASRTYGTANPVFSGTVTGQVNNDTFTETFSTTATGTSDAGTYAIVPAITGTALANYLVTTNNGTLTITRAASATTFALSNNNLTFTAQVASVAGVPTGSVTFYAGSTALGTGTLSNGTASYTAPSFPTGNAILSATYSGGTNFAGSTSAAVPVLTMTATSTSLNVSPAGAVQDVFTFGVAPGYTGTLQFACTGLPQYATCSFSPTALTFTGTSNTATATMTINTGGTASLNMPSLPGRDTHNRMVLAIFGLPGMLALGWVGRRRKLPRSLRLLAVPTLLACIGAGILGCGAASSSGSGGSKTSSPTPSGTYTLQMTATGASGLAQTTTLTLTVQ